MCAALTYLLDSIFIRFDSKLYRRIVGIPMGTNCAPLTADLFLFCYDRDFMASLSYYKEAEIIQAFNSTSLDDLLNIDNPYFERMVVFIHLYHSKIKLMPLIQRPHFWIYIYLFQTRLFHPKFLISATTLILP